MKKILAVLTAMMVITQAARAQLIWRGAGMLKQGEFLAQASNFLTDFNRSYSWGDEKWVDFPEGNSSYWNGSNTMLAYGVNHRLEVMVHVPVSFRGSESGGLEKSAAGMGDIYLKSRFAVLPWAKDRHGVALLAALRLPTGDDKAEIALGDGSTDLGLGAIYTTPWKNNFRGHLRAACWLNGRTDANVKVGDEVKFIAKVDVKLSSRLMAFVTCTHYRTAKIKDANGEFVDNTQKVRNYLSPGVVCMPVKGLNVRPKLLIPLGGRGGSLFSVKPMLDFWYTFRLFA